MGRKLLVDGYNVIRQTPPYVHLAERDDMEAARAALVADVAAYAGSEWDATVVFDGGANPRSTGEPHEMLGVQVVFSAYGMSADTVIEGLARSARDSGHRVEVVTSDAQTQWAVMGGGVARRSAGEFAGELHRERADWAEHTPSGRVTARLEDRIPARVRAELERWAREG